MGLKSAKILFNKPSSQRWDTSEKISALNNAWPTIFPLIFLMFLDGLVWGSICSMELRPSSNLHSMTVVSVLTGVAVMYMIHSSPFMHMVISFIAGEFVSLAVQWMLIDEPRLRTLGFFDPFFLTSAFSQLLFIIALFWQTKNNSMALKESIELRFTNKDLYDQAESSRQQALQANAAKSKFLAAASHDLRQPVHAQGLFLEVLGQTRVTPQQQEIIDSLRSATRATRDMLDSLLDFSRIEAGVIHPVKQNFPLQQLLHAIENDLAPVADAKKLAYRSRDTRVVAQSDPALVDLILRNLASNAIRYTDHGGVLVACRQRGDKVLVEVCDTGIGIAPENQQDIFREFHQLGNPERDRRKGLGLGLAIVQGLTHTLGHRLTLFSKPGRGSVFRLELPLINNEQPFELEPPVAMFTTPLKGYHALVIEDDDIVLQAMVSLLRSWGMTCDSAEGLKDALQLAGTRVPDVLVCDFRLREYNNGTEVIAAVRQALQLHIPVQAICLKPVHQSFFYSLCANCLHLYSTAFGFNDSIAGVDELVVRPVAAERRFAIGKRVSALALAFAVLVLADIFFAVGKIVNTETVFQAILEFALEIIALVLVSSELQNAATFKFAAHKVTGIGIIGIVQNTATGVPLAHILAFA